MAEKRGEQKQQGQGICYCEKGIEPKDAPGTQYRCPVCGGVRWPKEMD